MADRIRINVSERNSGVELYVTVGDKEVGCSLPYVDTPENVAAALRRVADQLASTPMDSRAEQLHTRLDSIAIMTPVWHGDYATYELRLISSDDAASIKRQLGMM